MKKLRVWGMMAIFYPWGQRRAFVATPTKKEAARLLDVTLHEMNGYASETGNEEELRLALANPGVVFAHLERKLVIQPVHKAVGGRWEVLDLPNKYEALCAKLVAAQIKIHDTEEWPQKYGAAFGVLSEIMQELHADGYELRTGKKNNAEG